MVFYENKSNDIYYWDGSDMTFPPHIHKELELVIVTGGELYVTIDSKTYLLRQGDMSFAFPNTIHSYSTTTHCDYSLLLFKGSMLPLYQNQFFSYRPVQSCIPNSQVPKDVHSLLSSIRQEALLADNTAIITGYLYLIVGRLLPFLDLQKNKKNDDENMIERILQYIQLNYLYPISSASISNELSVSPFALSRIFSNNIGIRLDQYINELRINYANHLLSSTHKKITDIALDSGFETLRTFNRVYKSITSTTPREYRKQQKISYCD